MSDCTTVIYAESALADSAAARAAGLPPVNTPAPKRLLKMQVELIELLFADRVARIFPCVVGWLRLPTWNRQCGKPAKSTRTWSACCSNTSQPAAALELATTLSGANAHGPKRAQKRYTKCQK